MESLGPAFSSWTSPFMRPLIHELDCHGPGLRDSHWEGPTAAEGGGSYHRLDSIT